jgi:hypothetical protein
LGNVADLSSEPGFLQVFWAQKPDMTRRVRDQKPNYSIFFYIDPLRKEATVFWAMTQTYHLTLTFFEYFEPKNQT